MDIRLCRAKYRAPARAQVAVETLAGMVRFALRRLRAGSKEEIHTAIVKLREPPQRMEECSATLSGFNDAWLLEASGVFEMDLPDPVTGVCPSGDVPVYRVWNNRGDSNHRYRTSIVTRDQRVAKGHIVEGSAGLGVNRPSYQQ